MNTVVGPADVLRLAADLIDVAWISTVHPGIAAPLAAWLRVEAHSVDCVSAYLVTKGRPLNDSDVEAVERRHAHPLALARALLNLPEETT